MTYLLFTVLALILLINEVQSFMSTSYASNTRIPSIKQTVSIKFNYKIPKHTKARNFNINANGDDSNASEIDESGLTESDQTILGVVGVSMSILMLYSEYVLKMTGRGLPAGPFGLLGAIEGLSYLGVPGLVAFSVFTKIKTVRFIDVKIIPNCIYKV